MSYDASVLTAIDYGFYIPFENPLPSEINDTAGYVAIAANTYMGDPDGFTTINSVPVARIDFLVNAKGTSLLDIHNSSLANIYAQWIPHDVLDGFFANIKTSIPNTSPTVATTPKPPNASSSREINPQQPPIQYRAGIQMNEPSDAKGMSGNLHIYKNYQPSPSTDYVLFWLSLYRSYGSNIEWFQIGYQQLNYKYHIFTETWCNGKRENKTHFETFSLTNHYLEIVETTTPEKFEARINGTSVRSYTFNITRSSATENRYDAKGEMFFGFGSLRGHMWNLEWHDSNGASHNWEQINVVQESPPNGYYTVLLNSTSDFYATGSGNSVFRGDVNGDGVVSVLDGAEVSAHWSKPAADSRLGPLGYDSNADVYPEMRVPPQLPQLPDVDIDVSDAGLVSAYWTGPPKGPYAP